MHPDEAWEITGSGARTFTAIGNSCSNVMKQFRQKLHDVGIKDSETAGLLLQIGFADEYFEGTLTVEIA